MVILCEEEWSGFAVLRFSVSMIVSTVLKCDSGCVNVIVSLCRTMGCCQQCWWSNLCRSGYDDGEHDASHYGRELVWHGTGHQNIPASSEEITWPCC